MDTWSTFLGTSCLCTKFLKCRCMGIRPSGLGLRLKSRQLQPGVAGDLGGARCPFVLTSAAPFESSSVSSLGRAAAPFRRPSCSDGTTSSALFFASLVDFALAGVAAGVRPGTFLDFIGLRDRARARRSSGSESSSIVSWNGIEGEDTPRETWRLRAAERVTGPL